MLEILYNSFFRILCRLIYKNHRYIKYRSKPNGEPMDMICTFCGKISNREEDIWWDGVSN